VVLDRPPVVADQERLLSHCERRIRGGLRVSLRAAYRSSAARDELMHLAELHHLLTNVPTKPSAPVRRLDASDSLEPVKRSIGIVRFDTSEWPNRAHRNGA
jgi:hypothetical protein